jgi:hypothetical protein
LLVKPRQHTKRAAREGASSPPRPPRANPSAPEITVTSAPIGRETLAAIAEEFTRAEPAIRFKVDTIRYDERPKPPSSKKASVGSSPELITVGEAPIGRATLAAIEAELFIEALAAVPEKKPSPVASPSRSNIFEISVFLVEGDEISASTPEEARRAFVQQRLMHRLPALSMQEVVRIDVSPGPTPQAVMLHVWSRVVCTSG